MNRVSFSRVFCVVAWACAFAVCVVFTLAGVELACELLSSPSNLDVVGGAMLLTGIVAALLGGLWKATIDLFC